MLMEMFFRTRLLWQLFCWLLILKSIIHNWNSCLHLWCYINSFFHYIFHWVLLFISSISMDAKLVTYIRSSLLMTEH
ncbi:hypothetical protein RJT34_31482 [Clitoria ternatea]|uniref:Uncharacterized protein n=1 Tax=Clitoria ternatea TaxID=43366 RepID=A0AAN9F272_CLITE